MPISASMLMFFWGTESRVYFVMWKVYEQKLYKSKFTYEKLMHLYMFISVCIIILLVEILERTQDEKLFSGTGINMME